MTVLVINVCHFYSVTPIYFPRKTGDLFCSSLSFLLISLGCHPLDGVIPHLFLTVRPRLSTVPCKFSHFFPSGASPWRMSPGAVRPPPLVTPLHSTFKTVRQTGLIERHVNYHDIEPTKHYRTLRHHSTKSHTFTRPTV